MGTTLADPFALPFMARALTELLILAALCAVVGVFVQIRRLAFTADALTHTVFPGVVIGYLAAGDSGILPGALAAGLVTAGALTALTRTRRVSEDAAVAVILTAFFAVGVVLVSRQTSYTADLTAFLFGRLLMVSPTQIAQTAVVAAIAIAALAATAKEQVLRAFDPVTAETAGYRIGVLDLILNAVVALVIVAAIHAVGTVLVIALLIVPAATGRLISGRLWIAGLAGWAAASAASYIGLVLSYAASVRYGIRLASGATVVVVLCAGYLLAALAQVLGKRRQAATAQVAPG
jgi:manganese/iron transport system permease protein